MARIPAMLRVKQAMFRLVAADRQVTRDFDQAKRLDDRKRAISQATGRKFDIDGADITRAQYLEAERLYLDRIQAPKQVEFPGSRAKHPGLAKLWDKTHNQGAK